MKKFIIAFTIFFSFSITSNNINVARANVASIGAIGSGLSIGSVAVGTGVTLSAPVVGGFIIAALSAGLIINNAREIRDFVSGAYHYLNGVGVKVGEGIKVIGSNTVSLTSSAKTSLIDYIKSLKSSSAKPIKVPILNSYHIEPNETYWFDTIPYEVGMDRNFSSVATGSLHASNIDLVIKIAGYSATYPVVGNLEHGVSIYEYEGYLWGGRYKINLPTYGDISLGLLNYGSFATDVGVIENILPIPSGNVSAFPDSSPYYRNPSLEGSNSTSITIPNSLTYGDVMTLPYTQVIEKVIVKDTVITEEGTGSGSESGSLTPTLPSSSSTLDFSPLVIDVSKKFPFCLPFDLVSSIRSFNVKSAPPKFVVPFDIYGSKADITIDFKIFEPWAVIIRWAVLLGFSATLIIITRKIIS